LSFGLSHGDPYKSNRSHTCREATPKTMKMGEAICAGEGRGSVAPL
jgi:hypothetical protein